MVEETAIHRSDDGISNSDDGISKMGNNAIGGFDFCPERI
jgi:hypothetical protein